ncbi:kinesin-like protein KIN-7D, mitochondrial [Olea europaea var. sylvestris]|uniref:kinesin-like protein KIN-7D, mitochondrial n=1 Tax=Olea europaea var. sylvestris TaxID=158386 RepID=UPI000C1CEC6C|nr:kinesin-like protein KIN-7D, mitochondrial [Olea europaea var. sylvestris]
MRPGPGCVFEHGKFEVRRGHKGKDFLVQRHVGAFHQKMPVIVKEGPTTDIEYTLQFGYKSRRGRINGRASDVSGVLRDDFDSWNLDPDDLKMELQVRKQREIALEAALAEKEFLEDEYRKKVAEAKKREMSLENDLANMWVLVAQLKKDGSVNPDSKINERQNDNRDRINDLKLEDTDLRDPILKGQQAEDHTTQLSDISKEESLVVRLKARIQEIKEKELGCTGNGDANSHVCKVYFESPAASMLIPCRHFCFCKPCSLACSECPICRTNIADRIFAFT